MKADNLRVHFVLFSLSSLKCHFLTEPLFTIFLIITVIPLNLCLFLLEQNCLSKSVEESVLCAFFVVIKIQLNCIVRKGYMFLYKIVVPFFPLIL